MAEEIKIEIPAKVEPQLDDVQTEDQKLEAELARIKQSTQPPPPDEAAAAEPVPTEAPVPTAAKPDEPPKPPEQKRDGAAWRMLRQREKELEEARAELARREAAGKPPPEPDFETQPADFLKRGLDQTTEELRRVQGEIQRRDYLDKIKRQEDDFTKAHPDYYDATQYLIQNDVKEWERTGASAVQTHQVMQAARSTDPRYAGYKQNVERLAAQADVQTFAEKEGRDPYEVAAYVVARDQWLTARRDLIAQGADATGRSMAEIAYEIARDRGYNGRGDPDAARKAAEAKAAQERVQQSRRVSDASRSLSDSATEGAQEIRVIRSRQDVLNLDDATLDNLIASGKYREI